MAGSGEAAAHDCAALDLAVGWVDCVCGALRCADLDGGAGDAEPDEDGPAKSAHDGDDCESGDSVGDAAGGSAGGIWCSEPDADDSGIGDGRADAGVSGLHPGVLWVV